MKHNIFNVLIINRWFVFGIILAVLLVIVFTAGAWFSRYDPYNASFSPLSPPSARHWLGVNDGGMDIFSELMYAVRNTVLFGVLSAAAALALGIFAGLTAAWKGGLTGNILMRLSEVIMSVPPVMIMIIVASFMRPSAVTLAFTLSLVSWPTTAKAIRSQALALRERMHVRAARDMGGTSSYIIVRHLLPELFPLYLIGFIAKLRMAVFMEASLAFLGLFDPARKSIGSMIRYALQYYYLDVWLNWLIPPVVCFSLIIMSITFLAISLEEVFDPRLKEI
ncbi:MAG: ABC transporter permease [Syntrophales bacterium]|jgi:peptide/nickel transport system permease protein|nr:ABC transporter permease [Syntrophales bacterium]MDY0045297.1 ABC transporter permease [Syntrophales bacterium]